MRKVTQINPVAKALLQSRRRTQSVPARKGGKAKYNRKQEKERTNAEARNRDIRED
jgi:hypothetical protein